jgi:hypothetical protein
MDATRPRRTRDRARQRWYARYRQQRFARFLGFSPSEPAASHAVSHRAQGVNGLTGNSNPTDSDGIPGGDAQGGVLYVAGGTVTLLYIPFEDRGDSRGVRQPEPCDDCPAMWPSRR